MNCCCRSTRTPVGDQGKSELAELNLDAGAQDAVIEKLTATLKQTQDPALKFELNYQLANIFKRDNERQPPCSNCGFRKHRSRRFCRRSFPGEARLALTGLAPHVSISCPRPRSRIRHLSWPSRSACVSAGQNMTGQHKEAASTSLLSCGRTHKVRGNAMPSTATPSHLRSSSSTTRRCRSIASCYPRPVRIRSWTSGWCRHAIRLMSFQQAAIR